MTQPNRGGSAPRERDGEIAGGGPEATRARRGSEANPGSRTVAARPSRRGKIRVRARRRPELDLHLLAQAVVMIGEDLERGRAGREQPRHPSADRPTGAGHDA